MASRDAELFKSLRGFDNSLEHLAKLAQEARERLYDAEAGQGPVARAREVIAGKSRGSESIGIRARTGNSLCT